MPRSNGVVPLTLGDPSSTGCDGFLVGSAGVQHRFYSSLDGDWADTKGIMIGKSNDTSTGLVRAFLTYAGGAVGTRVAVRVLCQEPKDQAPSHRIVIAISIGSAIGAALGFHVIW